MVLLVVFGGIWIYIGGRSRSVELRGAHEGGARPGGRHASLPRGLLEASLTCTSSLMGFFPSKNEFREVSGQLYSI